MSERYFGRRQESVNSLPEYVSSPEGQAEVLRYLEYLEAVETLLPPGMPAEEQDELRQSIHREVTVIPLPSSSATATRSVLPVYSHFPVGKHMDITVGRRAQSCWPDSAKKSLWLGDGKQITPDT